MSVKKTRTARLRGRGACVVAALLVTAPLLSACNGLGEADDGTVRIGVIAPLTGSGSALGTRARNGAVLRLKHANKNGGLDLGGEKAKIEWVVADTESDVSEGVSQIRRLVQVEEVDAIVGGTLSDITLAMMEIAEELETPMIVSGAVSPDIPRNIRKRDYQNVFMSSPTAGDRASADAKAIHDLLKPKRVFTISQETAWGIPMQEAAEARLKKLDSDIEIRNEFVEAGHTDFGAVVGKVRGYQPDVVYASLVGSEMFSFMQQLRGAGVQSMVFGASSDAASTVVIDELGKTANGVLANLVWAPTDGDKRVERFAADYEAEHGHVPADVEAQAYDAASMLVAALRRAGGSERGAVAEALGKVKITGVRGPQHFEPDDHSTRGLSFVVAQIQDGEHVILWPKDRAKGSGELTGG